MKRILRHIKLWWTNPVTIYTRSDNGAGEWCSPEYMASLCPTLRLDQCERFLLGAENDVACGFPMFYRDAWRMCRHDKSATAERAVAADP